MMRFFVMVQSRDILEARHSAAAGSPAEFNV
jgi:hypothetical protein